MRACATLGREAVRRNWTRYDILQVVLKVVLRGTLLPSTSCMDLGRSSNARANPESRRRKREDDSTADIDVKVSGV